MGSPSFPQRLACPVVLRVQLHVSAPTSTGLSPSLAGLSQVPFDFSCPRASAGPTTPALDTSRSVWAGPLSLATTQRNSSLFLRVTKMFQFTRVPHAWLWIHQAYTRAFPHVGFPIRTSPVRTVAHTSPELIAVYHVLHRHLTPRHSTMCS